ncbi:N-acetylmuramidase domain-containing protein [Hwangdonia lutea]|uniref:N-acetylmuramidase domain-containing protein n=1 Tax=Hwangdonia lutea TaxID=3075823 RepID=A0AA97EMQ2_9FLAO|nr:N-acetylmuramidase domain-containing protein [Hwangdonia sp. SCSIO 19198]WOD42848.1 N-acetylmuramidase domain-containing protein [Hwangdonia sp. SCSIO 19198]
MKTLKHRSRGEAVYILEELLVTLGYDVNVSNYFGVIPKTYVTQDNKDVLYKIWTRNFYVGRDGKYNRLEKAVAISNILEFYDAAYCSASWGTFQIMDYHFKSLDYDSIGHFVSKMKEHERKYLKAFGKFISINYRSGKSMIDWLRNKNWRQFAHGYNGSGYEQNNYHTKLHKAYERFSS